MKGWCKIIFILTHVLAITQRLNDAKMDAIRYILLTLSFIAHLTNFYKKDLTICLDYNPSRTLNLMRFSCMLFSYVITVDSKGT